MKCSYAGGSRWEGDSKGKWEEKKKKDRCVLGPKLSG